MFFIIIIKKKNFHNNKVHDTLFFYYYYYYYYRYYYYSDFNDLISAKLDIMAGDLSKLNEFFYEDPLIIAKKN